MPVNGAEKNVFFLEFNFVECLVITHREDYHCWDGFKYGLDYRLKLTNKQNNSFLVKWRRGEGCSMQIFH